MNLSQAGVTRVARKREDSEGGGGSCCKPYNAAHGFNLILLSVRLVDCGLKTIRFPAYHVESSLQDLLEEVKAAKKIHKSRFSSMMVCHIES